MRVVYVSLPTVKVVHDFVVQISKLKGDFDLKEGQYVLDAKSLMGILSLDIKKPIKLLIEKDTEETMKVIERFMVKEKEIKKEKVASA